MLVDFGLRYPGYSSTSASPTTMPSRRIGTGTWSFSTASSPDPAQRPCLGHIQYGLSASPYLRRWGALPPDPAGRARSHLLLAPPALATERAGRTDDLHQAHSRLCIDQTQAAVRAAQRHLGIVNARSTMCTPSCKMVSCPRPAGLAVGKTSLLHAPLSAPVHPCCVLRCSPISSRSTLSAIVPASRTINFHRRSRCPLHLTADDPHLAQSLVAQVG